MHGALWVTQILMRHCIAVLPCTRRVGRKWHYFLKYWAVCAGSIAGIVSLSANYPVVHAPCLLPHRATSCCETLKVYARAAWPHCLHVCAIRREPYE